MQILRNRSAYLAIVLASLCAPVYATVTITSIKPSVASPQPIGKIITYTIIATDTNPGPLTFQFKVTAPGAPAFVVYDYNVGTNNAGTWTSQPMVWSPASSLLNNRSRRRERAIRAAVGDAVGQDRLKH